MRRDAPCTGVDVGNEVVLALPPMESWRGWVKLTYSPPTHYFYTLTTHSNPTYPLLPHPITTRATHTYFITHSPSLPYLHHPFIILPLITHHTLTYTSLYCFANHTLTTHLLYPSLQHPHHPAWAPHYNTSPHTYSTPHPHPHYPPTVPLTTHLSLDHYHTLTTQLYVPLTTIPSPPTYCTPHHPPTSRSLPHPHHTHLLYPSLHIPHPHHPQWMYDAGNVLEISI